MHYHAIEHLLSGTYLILVAVVTTQHHLTLAVNYPSCI